MLLWWLAVFAILMTEDDFRMALKIYVFNALLFLRASFDTLFFNEFSFSLLFAYVDRNKPIRWYDIDFFSLDSLFDWDKCWWRNNKLRCHHGNRQHLVPPLKTSTAVSLFHAFPLSIFFLFGCQTELLIFAFCAVRISLFLNIQATLDRRIFQRFEGILQEIESFQHFWRKSSSKTY